jgi:hypothetical protein
MKTFNSFIQEKQIVSDTLNEKADIFGVFRSLSPLLHTKEYKLALVHLKKFIMMEVLRNKNQNSKLRHSVYYYAHDIGKKYGHNVDARILAKMFLKWYNEEYPDDDYRLNESLSQDDSVSTWIKDFQKSDAPQFKGKNKEERRKMAIAAFMSSKKKSSVNEDVLIQSVLEELSFEEQHDYKSSDIELAEELIEEIWEETLFHMFDEGKENTEELVESILQSRDRLLYEEKRKDIPKDSKVVFGRVISTKTDKMIGKIIDDKFVPIKDLKDDEKEDDSDKKATPDEKDDIDLAPAHVKNVFKRIKKEIEDISSDLGESKESIAKALSEKSVQGALKHTGYSIKKAGSALFQTAGLINSSLSQGFKELEKAGALTKLRKGTEKIDGFLDRHPFIKKVSGPLIAGALIYQWNNMSFSGDFNSDFDVTQMIGAATGQFSLTDLISTSDGVKSLTQLMFGLATGKTLGSAIGFPWKLGITAALVYTGAKKAHNEKLASKAWNHIQKLMNDNKKEEVKEEFVTIAIDESSSVPNQKDLDRKIKYLLTISDVAEDLLDAINDNDKKTIDAILKKEISNTVFRKHITDLIYSEINKK